MTQNNRNPWMMRMGWAAALVVVFLLGYTLRGGGKAPTATEGEAASVTTWTCSMHPQIQLPEPTGCPLCGMDLIPLETGADDGGAPFSLVLSPSAQALAEIETTPVRQGRAEVELDLFGKLVADETAIRRVAAWVPGRIERLHVSYTGQQVRKGQKLFDLFSPELYSAQEEFLQTLRSRSVLGGERAVESARERLRLLGLPQNEIARVEESGQARNTVSIAAPIAGTVTERSAVEGSYVKTGDPIYTIADLSGLWLELEAYESELTWLRMGEEVEFRTQALPGETFRGRVTFIDPVLNDRTRTARVRIDVPNPQGRLKPGMLAQGQVLARLEATDSDPAPLLIPKTAPLLTGERAVVYVADPTEPGRFHGRDVVLGPRTGDEFVVLSGLEPGERVVSNGAFKIDSALQIRGERSMMNPTAGGQSGGKSSSMHGSADVENPRTKTASAGTNGVGLAGAAAEEVVPVAEVTDAFRAQLGTILDSYFEVSTALSLDDEKTAQAAATRFTEALGKVDPSTLNPAGLRRWEEARKPIEDAGRAVAKGGNLVSTRDAFFDLSNLVISTVRAFGASSESPVLVYHCPMARDGAGADWLQNRKGTENPYWGSQMYRCGSETDVIVPDKSMGDDSRDRSDTK